MKELGSLVSKKELPHFLFLESLCLQRMKIETSVKLNFGFARLVASQSKNYSLSLTIKWYFRAGIIASSAKFMGIASCPKACNRA